MSHHNPLSERVTRWMNRFHAWRATFGRAAAGFVSQPEPKTIGRVARGRQLCAGNFLFAGRVVEAPGKSIWDLGVADRNFNEELHGFAWLDDLAASGDPKARSIAQEWTRQWVRRYGHGTGEGWTPDLTGRRLIRWINHAIFLLTAQEKETSDGFYRSLGQQTVFLARRWHTTNSGVPRFEALTGLIYAGLATIGMDVYVDPAVKALARECRTDIDEHGGIPSRNPEELLEIFTLLNWAASALAEAGKIPPKALLEAIERTAPTLRALRHSDGSLARFHGGGRGLDGRLDNALASSGIRTPPRAGLAMGYARLSAGRTSVIIDVAPPPHGPTSQTAHASTLAFELTSGRRAVIVNCGSGVPFGAKWAAAGRLTALHSTLEIKGHSSAIFGTRGFWGDQTVPPPRVPGDVRMQSRGDTGGTGLIAGHDGYVKTHGLTHVRTIELARDGRGLVGDDTLATISKDDNRQFDRMLDQTGLSGIPFNVHFHLHPEADATLDMGGAAVSVALRSGEIWIFRHDGVGELSLEGSFFLEKGRLKPRATKQIVLSAKAVEYATRVRWTFAKAQDTPTHLRDLERDESQIVG